MSAHDARDTPPAYQPGHHTHDDKPGPAFQTGHAGGTRQRHASVGRGRACPAAAHTTVGELRQALTALLALPDDTHLYFGDGQLSFNRLVEHGGGVVQIEFNEIYAVTPDPTGG